MKAICINGETQTFELVDVNSEADIKKLVASDTIEKDETGPGADHLFFDEECFLKSLPGKFKIDRLIPVSGKGVVVGYTDDGVFCDVEVTLENLKARTLFS